MSDKLETNAQNDSQDESDSQEEIEESEDDKQKRLNEIMKEQEAQIKTKLYAGVKGPGPSSFLQKKLSKGTKYFDSGDYYKDKNGQKPQLQGPIFQKPASTGEAIPTPDSVPHKKNLNPSSLATS